MKTVQLPIQIEITQYLKQYSNVVHIAYNKFRNTTIDSLILEKQIQKMNNFELLDASMIRQAVLDARDLIDSRNEIDKEMKKKNPKAKLKEVIFGGRKNWEKYNNGEISKEEWTNKKLRPLIQIGEKGRGNRKFKLDIKENNQILFCPRKGITMPIALPNIKGKYRKYLIQLQDAVERGEIGFTIKLNNHYVQIIFDEKLLKKLRKKVIKRRILSIDSNPNYIALVICDYNKHNRRKIIHIEVIDLKELNKLKNTNKIHYEMYEISKLIINLAIHYNVESIVVEKLNIQSSDKGKGKFFNKLCNQIWQRNIVFDSLESQCTINDICFVQVDPAYSSFIGQIENSDEIDSISASLEIGRRGNIQKQYNDIKTKDKLLQGKDYIENKEEKLQVQKDVLRVDEFVSRDLVDRWKKKLKIENEFCGTFKDLYKKSKAVSSYRNLFDPSCFGFVYRLKSEKSFVSRYIKIL